MLTLGRLARRAAGPSRGVPAAAPRRVAMSGGADAGLVTLTIDGKTVSVPPSYTIMQAADEVGVDIPRFCFHERLSIAGNCRMCLVEIAKAPKPAAACAMPVMPGMVVLTTTPQVKKAREGVLEFLLMNHPLDCPVCDQGGECDLQDLTMGFGSDRSRFREVKRGTEDKALGPFIQTAMTRCIHCTRCVRFAEEIAGVDTLGVTGRGNSTEIGTYTSEVFDTELSGNVADICPVGALLPKPSLFTLRSWELESTESVDVMDAVGASIRVDTRGAEVMRVLPRLHEDVNEDWLADKSRFAYDGLKRQRLDTPMVRGPDGALATVTWPEAFAAVREALSAVRPSQIKAVAGDHADAEALVALKDLVNRLGSSNTECRQDGSMTPADVRGQYAFTEGIASIEEADRLLLVGSNPRMEAPLVNARIRKAWLHFGLQVASVGPEAELTYPHQRLGDDAAVLEAIADGKHPYAKELAAAERPMVVVGAGAMRGGRAPAVLAALERLVRRVPNLSVAGEWQGANFLQLAASRAAALDLGFVPGAGASDADVKFVYLLGADDYAAGAPVPDGAFVVYQGHHGDAGATRANVVLPGVAYTEKDATYVNTEGRVQRTRRAVGAIGEAREDWMIVRALSEALGKPLPYSSVDEVRKRLADVSPTFARRDKVDPVSVPAFGSGLSEGAKAEALKGPIAPALDNYFMTDPVSRASRNMARGTAKLPNSSNSYLSRGGKFESASAQVQQAMQ